MSTYLPKDILAGLAEAKTATLRKKSRTWVEFDGNMYPVLRMWERGFAMDANAVPPPLFLTTADCQLLLLYQLATRSYS